MYDAPMTLEEALRDPRLRRLAGFPEAQGTPSTPAPPEMPAEDAPLREAASLAPEQAPETDFSAMAQRYLAAKGAGRQADRLTRLDEGFKDATETILSARGMKLGRSAPPPSQEAAARQAYQDEVGLARTQAEIAKAGRVGVPKPGARQKSTDPMSPESTRLRSALKDSYPFAPESLLGAVTEDNFEEFRKILGGQAGINERTGARTDATAQREKDREQRAEQFAATMHFKWADMSQSERLSLIHLMDAKEAREATAATAAAKKEEGAQLPAGEAASLGQTDAALSALDDLNAAHEAMGGGLGGTLGSLIPASDAKLFEDKVLATAQAVGTILEGGKLAAGDEVKYRKMLPDVGDSPARRAAKIANLKKLLVANKKAKVEGFGKSGFNVKGFNPPAPPAKKTTGAPPAAPTGKVRVQKGSEVLEIDASDLKAAQADGYAKVGP